MAQPITAQPNTVGGTTLRITTYALPAPVSPAAAVANIATLQRTVAAQTAQVQAVAQGTAATPRKAYKPRALPANIATGTIVALYGRVGYVVSTTAVRKGHRAIAVHCPAALGLPACTLYAVPVAVAQHTFAPVQPIPHGHYYGHRGNYGQAHV